MDMSNLTTLITNISNCARCGGEHERISISKLTRPVECELGIFNYWAPCPASGEPILVSVESDEQEAQ